MISPAEAKKIAFLENMHQQFGGVSGFDTLRGQGERFLQENDVPTTKTESWKYTRLTRIIKESWKQGSIEGIAIENYALKEFDCYQAVFVNGQFIAAASSLPTMEGVTVQEITSAKFAEGTELGTLSAQEADWMEALNARFFSTGLSIRVEKGVQVDKPIYILEITSGNESGVFLRHHIDVAAGSEAQVVLHQATQGDDLTFSSTVTESHVAQNAVLHIDKVQENTQNHFLHATEWAAQARDSHFDIRTVTLAGLWTRNNLNILVNGENCTTNLFGTYMPQHKELVDNHTMVDHRVPHCESNEVYKGIVTDKATGVFNGKVFVREDAQKTNAYQQNGNIVLTDDAAMYSKPELEIYADDVKCSHGSTTGQFDEEAVFYLRARGLSEASARKLLVQAFISDIVDAIKPEAVREYCLSKIESRSHQ